MLANSLNQTKCYQINNKYLNIARSLKFKTNCYFLFWFLFVLNSWKVCQSIVIIRNIIIVLKFVTNSAKFLKNAKWYQIINMLPNVSKSLKSNTCFKIKRNVCSFFVLIMPHVAKTLQCIQEITNLWNQRQCYKIVKIYTNVNKYLKWI